MSFYRDNASLYFVVGDDVTVYPVPAREVAAWLAAGNTGATVRGDFSTQDVLVSDGEVAIEDQRIVFETTKARADANAMTPGDASIEFEGTRYDIVRRVPRDLFAEFHLEDDS